MQTFNRAICAALTLLTLSLQALDPHSIAQAQIKTLPLGNSITRGDGGAAPLNSYRKSLESMLSGVSIDVDFVGQFSDGDGTDNEHQGVAGARANELADSIAVYMALFTPDMVIVHAGTNDLTNLETPAQAALDVESIVDGIYNANPNTVIILATVVPRTDGLNGETDDLNERLRDLAREKVGAGYKIWLSDVNADFTANANWATDYMDDIVHPNDTGYGVVAATLKATIEDAINNPDPGIAETFNRAGPGLGNNWAADAAYQIVGNQLSNTDVAGTFPLATWVANQNPIEISYVWGTNATRAGINEGGFAVRLDAPTSTANGYFIWLGTSNGNFINIWQIVNGAPSSSLPELAYTEAEPVAGDEFKVKLSTDGAGHHFDIFVNDLFYGRVSDPNKNQGNTVPFYGGVMLKGGLPNDIDDYDFLTSDDQTPPGQITDLAVSSTTPTSATLTFTSVGDDGNTGQASGYDIRYSANIISEANFSSATQFLGSPAPQGPGVQESVIVTGLTPGTNYFFAAKARDEGGNVGAVSNSPSGKTGQAATFTDDFERTTIGPDWETHPDFAIDTGAMANTSTVDSWNNFLAILKTKSNPLEVALVWDGTANSAGIDEGGFALLMDGTSTTANGYLLFRRPVVGTIELWELQGGTPVTPIQSVAGLQPSLDDNDELKVIIRKETDGHYFDVYIDGLFDGTVVDTQKRQGNGADNYVGLHLHGNRENNVASFSVISQVGPASLIEIVSGDMQTGSINERLPLPLTVRVTDANGDPKEGEEVLFDLIQGNGTLVPVAPSGTRIDVGASQPYTDAAGNQWLADQSFFAGSYGYVGGNQGSTTSPISNTDDDQIYQTERWGLTNYRVDNLPNGSYTVVLHFCELNYSSGGNRFFDVKLEGNTVLTNFDVAAEAGGRNIAISRSFTVSVSDGRLDVDFVRRQENPAFVGIEILDVTDGKSDSDGLVAQQLTFGGTVGQHLVRVTGVSFSETQPATFDLTATAGPPSALVEISGNNQTGTGGAALTNPLVVEVRDTENNPVSNYEVIFVMTRGGGTLSADTVITNASGQASVTWTLGGHATSQTVEALTPGLSGSPVVFSATASGGIGTTVQIVSGNNQSGPAGAPLPDPVVLKVTDGGGAGVPNFPAGFYVVSGGGSIALQAPLKNTGLDAGFQSWATSFDVLDNTFFEVGGEDVGSKAVQLSTEGNTTRASMSQTFDATFADGNQVQIDLKYKASGTATDAFTLSITNTANSAVVYTQDFPGTGGSWIHRVIRFTWNAGSINTDFLLNLTNGQNVTFDGVSMAAITDANGELRGSWSLGTGTGQQQMEGWAYREGEPLSGSPLSVTATSIAGTPQTLAYESAASQIGFASKPLATPFSTKVTDANGNPVVGHAVLFTVTQGGGTLDGGVGSLTVLTGADGISSVTLTMGPTIGVDNIVTAEANHNSSPLSGSPLTFTGISAVPTTMARLSDAAQTGSATQPLDDLLKVLILDDQDRPLPGYDVTFTVTSGGGTVNGVQSTVVQTGANGEAAVSFKVGAAPGAANTVQVRSLLNGTDLQGSPLVYTVNAAPLGTLQIVSGNTQFGTVGAALAQALKLRVLDTRNVGIAGWPVTFSVKQGGGSIDGSLQTKTLNTDSVGTASVSLTLGPEPGNSNNVVEATATYNGSNLVNSPLNFTASATVGTPVKLVSVAGDSQRGVVGLPLSGPLQVKVVDALENPIAGHAVTFEVKAGNGNIGGQTVVTTNTNTSGIAQVSLTVGPGAGENNNIVEARASNGGSPLGGSPIIFIASATSSSARNIEYISGNDQQGTAGLTLGNALVVRVTDGTASQNPVPNHPVIFNVKAGGGTLNGTSEAQVVISTGSDGHASVTWMMGGEIAPAVQSVEATSTDGQQDLAGAPVVFNATAAAGPTSPTASRIEASGPVPADGSAASAISVFLKDSFGNPVVGHAVSIRVSGSNNTISQPLTLTDSQGKVTGSVSSTVAEMKYVTAFDISSQIDVTNGDSVSFRALAPSQLLAVSGSGQVGNVGTALTDQLVARVTDRFGNPVSDWEVLFSVRAGGGILLDSQPVMTDAQGMAKATYVVGPEPGTNTVDAEAVNLSVPAVSFMATGQQGAATQLSAVDGGNGQSGVAGEFLPNQIGVRVADGSDRPIFDHEVTFRVTFGGGSVNGVAEATSKTDHFGIARMNWRLGPEIGPNVLEAFSADIANQKEIFTAQGIGGAASYLSIVGGNGQQGSVGGRASTPLSVKVTDSNNNPVMGFIVNFQLVRGTGALSAIQASTGENGVVSVNFTFGLDAGERVVRAFGNGLQNSPLNFKLMGMAGAPKTLVILDGNNQTGTIGQLLSHPARVLVRDGNNNPVQGVSVSFVPTQNNGTFPQGPAFQTDARGIVAADWNLGSNGGANRAWAIVQGLPQVEFSATGVSNNLPVFTQVGAMMVAELQTVQFDVAATDADGDNITLGARNLPPGAQFDSLVTRRFVWQTGYDNAGVHDVVFTATDSRGDRSEMLVTIHVENSNRAPVFTNWQPASDNVSYETGATQPFEVAATDADGEQVGYLWFLNGRHVGSSSTYLFPANERGNFTLVATAFDAADTTRRTWEISVSVSVRLSSFAAHESGSDGIVLEWITESEFNNAGFNILRASSANGPFTRINAAIIPSGGSGQYSFVDRDVVAGLRYHYQLEDVSVQGAKMRHGPVSALIALPEVFELSQNYPNPFNPSTTIRYQLPEGAAVRLSIFNVLGQEVRSLVDKDLPAGYHNVVWDGRNELGLPVPSGVYYYRISAGKYRAARKMVLMK